MNAEHLRAQHGEDRLLAERFAAKRGGYYVEVGALDGDFLSNTYYFEKALGWSGVLVEANPAQAELCRANRPGSHVAAFAAVAPGDEGVATLEVADGNEGYSTLSANRTYSRILEERNLVMKPVEVRTTTLDAILEDAKPPQIDFVTIDVEGHERAVLAGFDVRRWKPTVILLEGASAAPSLPISWRLFRAGYARVRRVVINDWYEAQPLPRRIVSFTWSYVSSIPALARATAREILRSVGLLDALRARRARRS